MHFWKVQALTYLTGAWSYRWHAVGIAWIICFAGWGAVAALPDQYASEAKVYIDTDSLMTPLLKGIAVSSDSQAQIALMLKTFISRPNLEQVVRLSDPRGEAYTRGELEKQVTNLERKINVRSLGTRNYYGIAFSDNNSQYAQSVTQSLISILMDSNIGDKRRDIEGARTFLDRQVAEYENRLREADQRRYRWSEFLGRYPAQCTDRIDRARSAYFRDQVHADGRGGGRRISRRHWRRAGVQVPRC
jgi:polysaccharide chain length determinant protein (PEP-CTERM system associated)